MKVLHVLTDTNIGGAGRLLCNYLRHRGGDLDTAVVLPAGAELAPLVLREGVRVLETERGRDKSFDLAGVREYRHLLAAERPDAVVAHSSLSARVAAYLCRTPRKIYVRHCAYEPSAFAKSAPVRLLRRLADDVLTDAVIAVADAAKRNLTDSGIRADKITVIINGVEPLPEYGAEKRREIRGGYGFSPDDFVFLIAARLEAVKGHAELFRALKTAAAVNPKIKLLVAGEGSLGVELRALADSLGISERTVFAGFAEDIAVPMNAADAVVNASWGTETSSLSLSEGMSVGKPAVATDYGGNPHMVNGENGILVPTGDTEAMAAAMLTLAGDRARYERLSGGARRRYREEFTAAAMAGEWDAVIRGT